MPGQSYALPSDDARARQVDVRRGRTDRQAGNHDMADAIEHFGLRRGAGVVRARIDQRRAAESEDAARDGAARCVERDDREQMSAGKAGGVAHFERACAASVDGRNHS